MSGSGFKVLGYSAEAVMEEVLATFPIVYDGASSGLAL